MSVATPLTDVIGRVPYRMAFAGGWIDQPFISRLNPDGVGSMVVVAIEPTVRFMDRAGMATGTRKVIRRMWPDGLPIGPPETLVRAVYDEENRNAAAPSGSQDMIGLLHPGVNRLDYDVTHEGGVFPRHVESNVDPRVARWIERVIHVIPVAPRPAGYDPLVEQRLDPTAIADLGRSGRDCFDALVSRDLASLGDSMNRCMRCWASLLPRVVADPLIDVDLVGLLGHYQRRYAGAMFSGCGGGYLYVASDEPVPGAFKISVRLPDEEVA